MLFLSWNVFILMLLKDKVFNQLLDSVSCRQEMSNE